MNPDKELELMQRANSMADAVRSFVARALAPIEARLRALEIVTGRGEPDSKAAAVDVQGVIGALVARLDEQGARIKALEDRPELRYKGVWIEQAEPYSEGTAITHAGSLWIARKSTNAKPGTSPDWQLAVKRGADGKDAR